MSHGFHMDFTLISHEFIRFHMDFTWISHGFHKILHDFTWISQDFKWISHRFHMDSTGFDEHRVDDQHEFLMFVTNEGQERIQVDDYEKHIVEDGQIIELIFREI